LVPATAASAPSIPPNFPTSSARPCRPPGFEDADARTAELLQAAWVAFADTGTPVRDSGAAWSPYDLQHPRIHRIGNNIEENELTPGPVTTALHSSRAPS